MDIGSLTGQVSIEDQLSGGLTTVMHNVKSFTEDFDGAMGTMAIGVGIVAAAIAGIAISIVALGEKGSNINDVSTTLDHFAGSAENAAAILEKMTEGVKGTVSDFDLAKDASRLLSAGVQLTAEQFGTLTEAAFVLQNRGLGSTKEMMDLVSNTMITGRTRALAMKLGVVEVKDSTAEFAASLGLQVNQLNAAGQAEGKRLGIMKMLEAANKDAGVQVRDFGEQIEFAEAKFEDFFFGVHGLASIVAASPNVMRTVETIGEGFSKLFPNDGKTIMDAIVSGVNHFADGVTAAVPYIVSFGEGVKTVLNFMASHSDVLVEAAKIVGAFGAAWLVWTVGGALVVGVVAGFTAITTSITGITVAIAANPLGALAVAAVATGLAISKYAQSSADAAVATQTAGAQQDVMNKAIAAGDTALKGLAPSATNAAEATKFLAAAHEDAGPKIKSAGDAAKDAADKYSNTTQKVKDLILSLTNGDVPMQIFIKAFGELTDAQKGNYQTAERLVVEIEKLAAAHIPLNAAMLDTAEKTFKAREAYTQAGIALLGTKGITSEAIEVMKLHGLTEADIALKLGVTVEALKTYSKQLADTGAFEADSLKTSRQLWNDWAAIVEGDLVTTTFAKGRLEIQNWLRDQKDALNAWVKEENQKYPEQTERIKNEYENRLAAYTAIETVKLDQLDKNTARMDATGKAFYDRQAKLAHDMYEEAASGATNASYTEIAALKAQDDALTIAANNWLPYGVAGVTAVSSQTTAVNNTIGAVNTLAATTQHAAAAQVSAIGTVTQSLYAQIDAAFAAEAAIYNAQAAASGGGMISVGQRPGQGSFNSGDIPNAPTSTGAGGINYNPIPAAQSPFASTYHVPGFSLSGRATGGPVSAGTPYIVGEQRPEVFVPSSDGYILPNTPTGSGGDTYVFNVNGTAEETARKIQMIIMNEQRTRRKFRAT